MQKMIFFCLFIYHSRSFVIKIIISEIKFRLNELVAESDILVVDINGCIQWMRELCHPLSECLS